MLRWDMAAYSEWIIADSFLLDYFCITIAFLRECIQGLNQLFLVNMFEEAWERSFRQIGPKTVQICLRIANNFYGMLKQRMS